MKETKLKIKQVREHKGLTLRELSRKSGIAAGYLSELESDMNKKNNPTVKIICKLAEALQVKPEELFECKEDDDCGKGLYS